MICPYCHTDTDAVPHTSTTALVDDELRVECTVQPKGYIERVDCEVKVNAPA